MSDKMSTAPKPEAAPLTERSKWKISSERDSPHAHEYPRDEDGWGACEECAWLEMKAMAYDDVTAQQEAERQHIAALESRIAVMICVDCGAENPDPFEGGLHSLRPQ